MPRFRQVAEILKLMGKKERIRNIGVVAHIDHGKTTMTDSLLAEAGLLPWQVVGEARALDYLKEEQKRGITIKTANISLLYEHDRHLYVINLVDTPGHVDFAGKVARALRALDGAIVIVDAVEELMAQTETVTRQALEERVRPVLFINKVDRLITELRLNAHEIESKFTRIIREFNNLIEIHAEAEFRKKWKANPAEETVAFGSALHKWAFTLSMIHQKGMKFTDIIDVYQRGETGTLPELLPLQDAILSMVVRNVPSPAEAQKYRISKIWKGKLDSELGKAMANCDDDGPTAICITDAKLDPNEGLIATGRIFSGSIKEGDRFYLAGTGKECSVQQLSMYMGAFREAVDQITAGNIAALKGLDSAKAGETLIGVEYKEETLPFEHVKYFSEAVVTVAIEPKNPKDLPRLVESANRLLIDDPDLSVTINEKSGEYLISGMGELHLDVTLSFLQDYASDLEIITSKPTVDYREVVTKKGLVVTAKSLNGQNIFRVQVEPLEEELFESIVKDKTKNVWAVDRHRNILVNATEVVPHLRDVRDMIIAGFQWACKTGPLCEEPSINLKVNLLGVQIHEDPAMRESAQITRAMSRAILGSFLTAKPVLLEPVYHIEVFTPTQWLGACTKIITARRGKIKITENIDRFTRITGYIPVAETFGLTSDLRSATSGHAFWQSTFDHWKKVPENIEMEIIRQRRTRRGLSPDIPNPDKFLTEA